MRCCCRKLAEGPVRGSRHAVARLAPSSRDPQSLAPCSPPSRPLRAASGGGLRPALTAAALGAPSHLRSSGLDGGEHGAMLTGFGTKVRTGRRQDVIPGLGRLQVNGIITASPCIRSGSRARNPNPSCTSEGMAQKRRDPSTKRSVSGPRVGTVTRLSWVTSAVIGSRPII